MNNRVKVKGACYDKVACPNFMHTACNSIYFEGQLKYILKIKSK